MIQGAFKKSEEDLDVFSLVSLINQTLDYDLCTIFVEIRHSLFNFTTDFSYAASNALISIPLDLTKIHSAFCPWGNVYLDNTANTIRNRMNLSKNRQKFLGITILILNQRKLNTLPSEVCHLYNLQYLYLDNNQIQQIPASICNLVNLERLKLNDNYLQELPTTIGELKKLETLEVYNNQLTKIPDEIGNLINLVSLHLQNNQLECLPETIGRLHKLRIFDYVDNPLKELPQSLIELASRNCLFNTSRPKPDCCLMT